MKPFITVFISVIGLAVTAGLSAQTPDGSGSAKPGANPAPTPKTSQRSIDAEYRRLLALKAKLTRIPIDKQDSEAVKSFLARNENDIVYSEPAGEWFVRSDRFWELSTRNKAFSISEKIAWTAADNPLPGECEGYINCYVYAGLTTYGRYLTAYPGGSHSKMALDRLTKTLGMMAEALDENSPYEGPVDASDKADLQKMLKDLSTIIGKTSGRSKEKTISLIRKLADGYR